MTAKERFRILLPTFQVFAALASTVNTMFVWHPPGNPAWQGMAWQLRCGVNAPVSVIVFEIEHRFTDFGNVANRPIEILLETVIYSLLTWLLWYAAILEFEGRGQSVLTSRIRLRSVADLLLVLLGFQVALMGRDTHEVFAPNEKAFALLIAVPYCLWAMVIIVFYGHDFWRWVVDIRASAR